jgi:hypothetical protein
VNLNGGRIYLPHVEACNPPPQAFVGNHDAKFDLEESISKIDFFGGQRALQRFYVREMDDLRPRILEHRPAPIML